MSEVERRKAVISAGQTDVERWADPRQLEDAWEPRAALASDLIQAGSRVLDIGCGAMKLERHLPFGCTYQPCDVVARDARTIVTDLNAQGLPDAAVADADVVAMLGVWEYLYDPGAIFAAFARTAKPIVCSYCPIELSPQHDRRALGWVNDLSREAFVALAAQHGYRAVHQRRIDNLQFLFRFERTAPLFALPRKRVHVLSYNNIGNFGDRLGFHMLNEVLPSNADVSWGSLRPFAPMPDDVDLLIVGIGNSLFGGLLDDQLVQAVARARASIGIFGTQYRDAWPRERVGALLDRMTFWYARYQDDVLIYGRERENVRHLGDWLINAFPMAVPTDERTLSVGKEVWNDQPLDRTIQRIQSHRRVVSERLHPLLCALTSASEVSYKEQRETVSPGVVSVSGKFRSLLMDVFGRHFPEGALWPVDREAVARYKAGVRARTDEMRGRIETLLS